MRTRRICRWVVPLSIGAVVDYTVVVGSYCLSMPLSPVEVAVG